MDTMFRKNTFDLGTKYLPPAESAKFLLSKYEPFFLRISKYQDLPLQKGICEFSSIMLKTIACGGSLKESKDPIAIKYGSLKFDYNVDKTIIENLGSFLPKFKVIVSNVSFPELENLYHDMHQFYGVCVNKPNKMLTLDTLVDPSFLIKREMLINQYLLLRLIGLGEPGTIHQIIISILFTLNTKFFVSRYEVPKAIIMDISLHDDKYHIEALVAQNPETESPWWNKTFFGIVDKNGKVINDSSNLEVTKIVFGPFFSGILEHFGLDPLPPLPQFDEPCINTLPSDEQWKIANTAVECQFNYELSKTEHAVFVTFSTLKEAETFYLKYKRNIYPIWDKHYEGGKYLPVIDSECIEGKFTVRIPTAAKRPDCLINYTFEDFCIKSRSGLPPLNKIEDAPTFAPRF
jgi:hypothetical protein